MANNHETLTGLFSDIADAIRVKTGGTADMVADNFPTEIDSIVTLEEGSADATAVASDIASGKTAYVNGEKITGNLYNVGSGSSILTDGDIDSVVDDYLRVETDRMTTDRIFRTGSKIRVDVPMSDFGNATASEVANGKTFTSAAGLKVTGTGEMASELADELSTQDDLIAQIATALEGKTGEDLTVEMTEQNEIITTQDNLIAQIATALEGKTGASGGASLETCTIELNIGQSDIMHAYFTCINDGVITQYTCEHDTAENMVVSNVLSNSMIVVTASTSDSTIPFETSLNLIVSNNGEYDYGEFICVYKAPEANGYGLITCTAANGQGGNAIM